ncbi:MAG: hypothetical protein ACLQGV_02155 [Bryobacteraceae bacterium]
MSVPHLDPRLGNNFIDANFFDRTGGLEDGAVDTILRLHGEGAFRLLLPYSVKAEIEHPNTPEDVKLKAEQIVYTLEVELTGPEWATHDRIRELIRGNAQPGQHDKDAFHLVESQRYGGRFFITKDGRLLRKAAEIWEALPHLRVLKPSEFLTAYSAHAGRRPL